MVLFIAIPHGSPNAVDIIGTENTLRSGVFNIKPNPQNEVVINTVHKNKDIVLGKHTTTINTILNNKNISRRPARHEEKKTILQAVMGTIIVHKDDSKYHLNDHELTETDEFYKHFEILRFTEEFAQTCLETMIRSGGYDYTILDKIDHSLYKDLYDYSGLSHDLMLDWFKEMYAAHIGGIMLRKESIQAKGLIPTIILSGKKKISPTNKHADFTETHSSQKAHTGALSVQTQGNSLKASILDFDSIYSDTTDEANLLNSAEIFKTAEKKLELPKSLDLEHEEKRGNLTQESTANYRQLRSPSAGHARNPTVPSKIKPTTAISTKSDWTKSWKLENGTTIAHYPGYVELNGPIIDMWGTKITLDRKNIRGTIVNIHVQADMTEEEFVEALRKDENLVDQP